MSERAPPMNNIVLEGSRCPSPPPPRIRFRNNHNSPYKNFNYYNNKNHNPPCRSIGAVSSVTFSEIADSDYTTSDIDVFDTAIIHDDDDNDDDDNNDYIPGIPQRRLSMNEENIKLVSTAAGRGGATGDAAPCLPSRQQSVAGGSQKGGGGSGGKQQHQQKQSSSKSSDLNESNSTLNSGKKAASSSSSTEPMPEYLQQDIGSQKVEEMIESRLRELNNKAEQFKRVVDLRDRKYGLRTYRNCFVGSQACDRMVETGLATSREEAIELGRSFIQHLGLFKHVTNDHNFNDRYLFYEFVNLDNNNNNKGNNGKQNNSKKNNNNKKANRWNSVPQPTMRNNSSKNGPWYSSSLVRSERDITIMEGQPMSQQDLIADTMTTSWKLH